MLHCHQFAHHPSVRPAKLSSLFGNSSGSCFLHQLAASNINDAFAEGAQHNKGKRNCLKSRIRQHFRASTIATALQAYDLQEQIRKINFHEQLEFFNLFQHLQKYFPNAANRLHHTSNARKAPRHNSWIEEISMEQLSTLIGKVAKEKEQQECHESVEPMHKQNGNESVDRMLSDSLHSALFGANSSPKIIQPTKTEKITRKRRHSSAGTNPASQFSSPSNFFSQFPAESLSLVGVGAFGRVYRVHSKHNAFNDERMAVKLIPFNSKKSGEKAQNIGAKKYASPLLALAAMIAAVNDEEDQMQLDEFSTEQQVLREVSVLSALSSSNTARYRFAWTEKWSEQFDKLFYTHTNRKDSISFSAVADASASASFSDTSSEWSSSYSSQSGSFSAGDVQQSKKSSGSLKPKFDSVLVLLMDYYNGISLSEFISNPSAQLPAFLSHTSVFSSLLRLYLSYQILSSLEYIHSQQCIHRDLAPKNLIMEINHKMLSVVCANTIDEQRMESLLIRLMCNQVSADDMQDSEEWKVICSILAAFNVRLIDFGLSRQLTNQSTNNNNATARAEVTEEIMQLSVGVGTRSYAAPEQLKHHSSCTCDHSPSRAVVADRAAPSSECDVCGFADRADVFSCGLVLAEMLCAPFHTQMERIDFLNRMREHRWNSAANFQSLPKALKDVLENMLTLSPRCRPTAAHAKKSKAFSAVRKLLPFIALQKYEQHCA